MKSSFFLLALLILVSCGGKNTSGKPQVSEDTYSTNSLSIEEENNLRNEYLKRCSNALRIYRDDIARSYGQDRVGLIRNRLNSLQLELSFHVLVSERNETVSTLVRNGYLALYVGEEVPELSWRRNLKADRQDLNLMILHDVLTLGDIEDSNYRVSRRMSQSQRR